ncbi:hypothetical protein BDN71DRAFT_1432685 [Pleurotus eryngii]|uniref:Uncharacterized protein n=1 Tax=Pleurotus eryngii TaxID=5323 RepID=A0A9P5ZS32_PLEER|nr:hypothetical protein BDN71DRAFT_1432685 [Pleurotus eryngii]
MCHKKQGCCHKVVAKSRPNVWHHGSVLPLEKEAWAKWAQDMHGAQVEEAEICSSKLMDLPLKDRQDCLDHISNFFYPILDNVHELLNMHVTVLTSSPKPKKGGQLNVLRLIDSLHTGTNLSPIPKTQGEANEEKYQLVTQNFKKFLHTAYMQQQQIDAAIPHTLPQNLDFLLVMECNSPDDNCEVPKPSKSKSTARKRSCPEEAQPAAKQKAKASKFKRHKKESDSAEDSNDDTSAEEAFTKKAFTFMFGQEMQNNGKQH